MATMPKQVRVASNGRRTGSRPNAAAKKRSNASMSKTKKAARKGSRNPIGKHKKAKRNPTTGMGAVVGRPQEALVMGISGLASAVATRQLPQIVLGANNTGVEGYFANLVTALVATWAASAFGGAKAGIGALTGGMVILLDRVLTEQVSPIGPYLSLSGIGDPTAVRRLGTIRDGYFFHPGLTNPDGSMMVPQPVLDQAVRAVVAAYPQIAQPLQQAMGNASGGANMGAVRPSALRTHTANGTLMSSRFQGRFNTAQN
jgi:hypothetical protein